MKVIQSSMLFLFLSLAAFSQGGKYTTATISLQDYELGGFKDNELLLTALEAINEVSQNAEWALKPKTWFTKGKVYDYIQQDSILSTQHPTAIFEASAAYQKSLSFPDQKFGDAKLAKDLLYGLCIKLFNTGIQLFNINDHDNAAKYFIEAKNIKVFLDKFNYTESLTEKNRNGFNELESDAIFNAALSLQKIGKKEEAKAMMQELIDKNYDSPHVYKVVANYYSETGDTIKALDILDKGIEKYPDTLGIDLRITQINIYIRQRKTEQNITKIEKVKQLEPNNQEIYLLIGEAYGKNGEFDKAEKEYLAAIAINPTSENAFNAYNNLGAMYIDFGNEVNKQMMDDSKKLTDKQYQELTDKRNGHYNKAIPYLEKAYELRQYAKKKDEIDIVRVLKEVYAKLGMYDKSKEMKTLLEQLGG